MHISRFVDDDERPTDTVSWRSEWVAASCWLGTEPAISPGSTVEVAYPTSECERMTAPPEHVPAQHGPPMMADRGTATAESILAKVQRYRGQR
jgi:hypothetical protein